ncbi:uncharacterized protein EV422DRAFT_548595 [Fimicolochytrium jonesii]|uniref:uncharacterized protein n=1 Tax=Fimicolochytrium jonesii TaxID=1396493 RepID=UPI0022FE9B04|nr:uncharacterized protein EV422DRAFT_548595 [Fimicolochytrium jonesii]KAI8815657.1 hypothetical protein EV422DRAFT_548595 [Fimicolochytrium jonesii]
MTSATPFPHSQERLDRFLASLRKPWSTELLLTRDALHQLIHDLWPAAKQEGQALERAGYFLTVLSLPTNAFEADSTSLTSSLTQQIIQLAQQDTDEYVRALSAFGNILSGKQYLNDRQTQSLADQRASYEETQKLLETLDGRFGSPEIIALKNRVLRAVYPQESQSRGFNSDGGLAGHIVTSDLVVGSPEDVSPNSPNPHSATTPSAPGAPAPPAWMLKNRANKMKDAAYGTRRASTTSTKKGLMRHTKTNTLSVNDIVEQERAANEAKKKEAEEKRLAKERKELETKQEKERKQQEREEKRLEKIRQKEELQRQKEQAEIERKARIDAVAAERQRKIDERNRAAQEADRVRKEAMDAVDVAVASDTVVPGDGRRRSSGMSSYEGDAPVQAYKKPRTDSTPSISPQLPPPHQPQPWNPPPVHHEHAYQQPSNTDTMQLDSNPLPPPPPSAPESATAATYQTLVGDAILSSDDSELLMRFLEGDYAQSEETRLIKLGREPTGLRDVFLKFDYASGRVSKIAKKVGAAAVGKRKRVA